MNIQFGADVGASSTATVHPESLAHVCALDRHTVDLSSARESRRSSAPLAVASVTPIVFIVDDDSSVRESLVELIENAGWRAETFASAQAFLFRPRSSVPTCLILDVSFPGHDGLELQKRIAAERTDMPIIVITAHGDIQMTVRAMKAGAVEFLTKPVVADELLSAIGTAIERSRAALVRETQMQVLREAYASLSGRERQVIALVVAGKLNKQVGAELGISEITVKAHRGKAMRKMHAASLVDLVNMTAQLRL